MKRITSLVLALLLVLSSSLALAADFDLRIVETGEVRDFLDWPFDDEVYLDVVLGEEEGKYLIECEGKFYKAEEVVEASQKNPNADLSELVKDLEPVEKVPGEDLKVVEVSAINDVNVAFGTPVEELELPATVEVTLSNEEKDVANVTWNTENYDPQLEGEQVLEGTLSVPEGKEWTIPEELLAVTVKVIVSEDPQAAIVAAAEEAVKAYEDAPITNAEEIAAAEALETAAVEKVELVADAEVKAALEARIATKKAAVDAKKVELEETEKAAAIKAAIAKINLIGNPATLTLEDEAKVVEARTAVDAATKLGAVDTDIVNLDQLEAAEDVIKGLKETLNAKETAIQEAKVALLNLPLEVTLDNEEQVNDAAAKVAKALELGAEKNDFVNLWKLENAQAKIAELKSEKDVAEKLAAAKTAAEEAIAALPTVEEVKVEDKEAVANAKALVEAVKALDAEAVVEGEEVIVKLEAKIAELEEAATKELTVESVSAINNTGVTVIVEPVKEASEEATIEVKNSKGEVVAVEPLVVEVGETELVFNFVEEQKEEALVGVWKVNGVEYNFDAIKQLADIKKEAAAEPLNEIKFLAALNAAGIKNVDENRLGEYAEALVEKDEEIETLEDVQAVIDEENKSKATEEEQAAAVKAVKEAKNQIQLLAALEAGFERVNADWIVEYATDSTNGLLGKDNLTFEGIQNAVDAINTTKVNAAITEAEAALDSKLVATAKTLVENYIKEDGKNETTKKGMLDRLAVHQAVINVNLANTNNKLDAAFKALAELVEDTVFDIETVKPELLKAYRDAIAEEAKKENPANKTAEDIQAIVSAVNRKAAEAEEALKIKSLAVASDGVTNAAGVTVDDSTLADKRLVTVTGDYLALKEYPADNDTPPATAKWIGLKITLDDAFKDGFDLLLDGNDLRKDEEPDGGLGEGEIPYLLYYFVPQAGGNTKTLEFTVKKDGKVIKKDGFTIKFVDELSDEGALVMMNEAEDANAMRVAMSEMAALAEEPIVNYINLSSAAKLEVAEIVLAAREKAKDKKFAQVSDATTAITKNVTAYTEFLTGVNAAESIDDMNKELNKDVFPEFQKLSASEKIAKAEAVLNALNELRAELEDPTAGFETIAEIKAAAGL